MFDLRTRNKVNRIGLCGVNGKKFPGIRNHLKLVIHDVYSNINDISMETFPSDTEVNPIAYMTAIASFNPGDCVTIFTPDDTHFEIALACIERGLHVLVTKPAVKTLEQHRILHQKAVEKNVLCVIEVHKRFDPMYVDARDKIKNLGNFSYIYSYMSQPKHQLDTFSSWIGNNSSDISYYLNSHHIDFHEWCVSHKYRPLSVVATASTGYANNKFNTNSCEDTITLTVQWENIADNTLGTAVYTSSWIAPKSDVHSQQRFFYMGYKGEVNIDQAHRGYSMSDDVNGYKSINPLFMKYTPNANDGSFTGQNGYGYKSFEHFIDAVNNINNGIKKVSDYDNSLASICNTYQTTAILEAGRRSLDIKKIIEIKYNDNNNPTRPTDLI